MTARGPRGHLDWETGQWVIPSHTGRGGVTVAEQRRPITVTEQQLATLERAGERVPGYALVIYDGGGGQPEMECRLPRAGDLVLVTVADLDGLLHAAAPLLPGERFVAVAADLNTRRPWEAEPIPVIPDYLPEPFRPHTGAEPAPDVARIRERLGVCPCGCGRFVDAVTGAPLDSDGKPIPTPLPRRGAVEGPGDFDVSEEHYPFPDEPEPGPPGAI